MPIQAPENESLLENQCHIFFFILRWDTLGFQQCMVFLWETGGSLFCRQGHFLAIGSKKSSYEASLLAGFAISSACILRHKNIRDN